MHHKAAATHTTTPANSRPFVRPSLAAQYQSTATTITTTTTDMAATTTATPARPPPWHPEHIPAFQRMYQAVKAKGEQPQPSHGILSALTAMMGVFKRQRSVGFLLFVLWEALRDITLYAQELICWLLPGGHGVMGMRHDNAPAGSSTPCRVVPFRPTHQQGVTRVWTDGLNQTITTSVPRLTRQPVVWLFFKSEAYRSVKTAQGDLHDIQSHWMRPPHGNFFVAEGPDGEVVGCVACKEGDTAEWKESEVGSRRCRLTRLSVAPAWRKAGVGQALVAAVVAWARDRGMSEVVCFTSNVVAMRFYQKCGFETTYAMPMMGASDMQICFLRKQL